MTLEDAREQMAALDAEYHVLLEALGGGECSPAIEPESQDKPESIRVRENRRVKERFGYRLAGYPHIRPHLWCWMVDVHGSESNACGDEAMREALDFLEGGESDAFISRVGGALAQNIRAFITTECGLRISDSGGGCSGWHLGTPCSQAEMECLTGALHGKFAKAIEAGLLTVTVKFWGWKFR